MTKISIGARRPNTEADNNENECFVTCHHSLHTGGFALKEVTQQAATGSAGVVLGLKSANERLFDNKVLGVGICPFFQTAFFKQFFNVVIECQ